MIGVARVVAWLSDLDMRFADWRMQWAISHLNARIAAVKTRRKRRRAEAAATDADLALNAGAVQADLLSQDGGAR